MNADELRQLFYDEEGLVWCENRMEYIYFLEGKVKTLSKDSNIEID